MTSKSKARIPEDDELVYEPSDSPSRGLVFGLIGLVGLLLGLGSGLFYGWQISPVIERNTHPDQLREEDRQAYVIAIALDYGYTGDILRAANLLATVNPERDPFQLAADVACDLTRGGQIRTGADIVAMRHLISIFSPQPGVNIACDLSVYATAPAPTLATFAPSSTASPTSTQISTKTVAPTALVPVATFTPEISVTAGATERYRVVFQRQFCNPNSSGIIEVIVRTPTEQVPGIEVAVSWSTPTGLQEQRFFTGLKPEKGNGYADFKMEAGPSYLVSLPGRSDGSERVSATPCDEQGTLLSHEVIFQEVR